MEVLHVDSAEQLLNENGTMGTDSGELDQSETMDEYSREESVENEMRNKDEEVQPTTPLKQIDEISKISQHVINCREEDMQGDEFMQSIDESSEDESAESSEENVEASDGEDQMEIMTCKFLLGSAVKRALVRRAWRRRGSHLVLPGSLNTSLDLIFRK